MAKKNPVSLGGMQAAIHGRDEVSEEMLLASHVAVENAKQQLTTTGKSIIYKLVDTNIRGNYHFILIDDVKARPKKDKDGNETESRGNERMRVLRGVESIWQADQKDVDKDYIKTNKRYLVFQKGIAIVPETDTQVHEFMERSNANIDNPSITQVRNTKFFRWNPEKQAEELRKKQDRRIEAILKSNEVPADAMRKHALYLGISFVDSLGEALPENGIRVKYRQYADDNPELFLNSLNSPEVEVTYLVKKAIADSRIDIGRQPNTAYWADGGLICKIPVSQTAQKYLVELAMTNTDSGKEFLEALKTRRI